VDHRDVAWHWDENAPVWTELSRAGYDVYRDHLNTPAFLRLVPDVAGLDGLDLGCGEGHNTRLLAGLGARMMGLDISGRFLRAARDAERRERQGIGYVQASGDRIPLAGGSADFVTAFMSLMDMPNLPGVLAEVHRVLRPGGFLQFSIEHPLMATRIGGWETDAAGHRVARRVGGYFTQRPWVDEWIFSSAPAELRQSRRRFRIPRFPRTFSGWLNALIAAGLRIEAAAEPYADDEAIRSHPKLSATRIVPFFLHIRCRKSETVGTG
jgi:ubiquinone/menaquinone biosynthesis C-methylase UbiE